MIGFSWRQLGAFTARAEAIPEETLEAFAAAGGRYLLPLLAQLGRSDDDDTRANQAYLPELRRRCDRLSIRVGAWLNGWGGDADADADEAHRIVAGSKLAPLMLDLEAAYQGNTKLAQLTQAVRKRMPAGTMPIGVSTNSLNDSQVWNGRRGDVRQPGERSVRALNIAVSPQWYSSPSYAGPWTDPVANTRWLLDHGADDNLHDPSYADGRAVALSQVHPTLEPTGIEGASLDASLALMKQAVALGCGPGVQLYLLERTPVSDFGLLAAARGHVYA